MYFRNFLTKFCCASVLSVPLSGCSHEERSFQWTISDSSSRLTKTGEEFASCDGKARIQRKTNLLYTVVDQSGWQLYSFVNYGVTDEFSVCQHGASGIDGMGRPYFRPAPTADELVAIEVDQRVLLSAPPNPIRTAILEPSSNPLILVVYKTLVIVSNCQGEEVCRLESRRKSSFVDVIYCRGMLFAVDKKGRQYEERI